MRQELIRHYAHLWRIFAAICRDIDIETWKHSGHGVTRPNRLALHILQSTNDYIEDGFPLSRADGTLLDVDALHFLV